MHRRSSIDLNKISDNHRDSNGFDALADHDREAVFMRGPLMQTAGSSGSMDLSGIMMGTSGILSASSKDLGGLVNDVIDERSDDDASTVDGEADMNGR